MSTNPFRDLLNFADSAHRETENPCETNRYRRSLSVLGDAAMAVANRVGHPISDVESRVRALEDACRAVLDGVQSSLTESQDVLERIEVLATGFDARKDEPRPSGIRTVGELLTEVTKREQTGETNTADLDRWPGVSLLKALAQSWFRCMLTSFSLRRLRFELCLELGDSIDQGDHVSLPDAAAVLWSRRALRPPCIPGMEDLNPEECLQAMETVRRCASIVNDGAQQTDGDGTRFGQAQRVAGPELTTPDPFLPLHMVAKSVEMEEGRLSALCKKKTIRSRPPTAEEKVQYSNKIKVMVSVSDAHREAVQTRGRLRGSRNPLGK